LQALRPREGPVVRSIEWDGIGSVSHEELEAAILTSKANWRPWVEAHPYDPGTLEQDRERLRRLFLFKGFYEAEVQSQVEERGKDAVIVRFFVTPGPEVVLEDFDLSVTGDATVAPAFDASELARDLPLAVGEPFSAERYGAAKVKLLERFANLGHPVAAIRGGAEVRRDEKTASIAWTVDPGPAVHLGSASAVGLERVAPELVLGEVAWETGESFRPGALRETQRAIYDLGLFRSVSIQPLKPTPIGDERPPEEEWPVEIRVRERPPRSYRFGIGFGTEDLVRAKVEWKHRNLFGGLRSFRFLAKYSFLERGVEAAFVQPRFLARDNRLTLDASLLDETPPVFHTRGVSTGWLFDRRLTSNWKGRIGQRFEYKRVRSVEADRTILGEQENESFRLVLFNLGLRRSALDSRINPRSGTWLDLSLEPSARSLGSEVDYVKAVLKARAFFPLPLGLVLASRVELGTLEPLGSTQGSEIPIFKRFFAGGSNSVRGFKLDELGPRDRLNEPVGGLTLAEASVELRFPIWRKLGGVAFVDAGQVALDPFELRGEDFFYSAGGGLRYNTPIGPLRLDVGRILNPPSGVKSWGIHFSVGHAF
jgi:outer membrane protein assembly complex protein YaeT